jgi:hypothetical protein
MAFAAAFPGGDIIVSLGLCLFAFTTIIGWSFYGERCVVFLFGTRAILPFRIAWVIAVPVGTVVKLDLVWLLADTLNAFMAVPNLIALALLGPLVFRAQPRLFPEARMTDIHDNPEALVDLALERVGRDLRVGAPLGLGKPVQLLNAFYRRAAADPTISLQIFTALSLEVPTPSTQIEEALAGPIFERLFGDYEELDYMAPLRRGALPPNIRVSELYFKAGAMKGVASAQQGYISSNYTHIARDMCAAGVNVLCQMIAFRDDADGLRLSLSSNPDTATDLLEMLERERPGSYVALGQLHPEMPFMEHDAEVASGAVRRPAAQRGLQPPPVCRAQRGGARERLRGGAACEFPGARRRYAADRHRRPR